MPSASSRLPITGSTGPNAACLYSNDAHLGSFGTSVDYGFPQAQVNNAAAYIQQWCNGGPASVADMVMNQSSAACLTPSRSPHQCGVPPAPLTHAALYNPCSLQPPAPAYGAIHVARNVSGGVAYSSMPPSPPPSPPVLYHRPAPPYQHSLAVAAGDSSYVGVQQYYRPEWCCLLYTSPSPRDSAISRMPSSA